MRHVRTWMLLAGLVILLSGARAARAEGGLVALQTADPACPDDSGDIYVDCGNGTVTDNRSGLVWLQNADCVGELDWFTARDFVAGLGDTGTGTANYADCGLNDNSSPGEWRLPSAPELWEMFEAARHIDPACVPVLTNDAGDGCWSEGAGSSFVGVQPAVYWGSSPDTSDLTMVLGVLIGVEKQVAVAPFEKTAPSGAVYVWPVRRGQ